MRLSARETIVTCVLPGRGAAGAWDALVRRLTGGGRALCHDPTRTRQRIPEEQEDGFRPASKVTILEAKRWKAIIDRRASGGQ